MPRLLLMLAPWLCFAACSIPESAMSEPGLASNERHIAVASGDAELAGVQLSLYDMETAARPEARVLDRQVVHTAELAIEVAQTEPAVEETVDLVKKAGGYLSERDDATLTLRIPVDQFEAVLSAVKEMGRIIQQSRLALDVTEQWLDLKVRLENARRARERLLALLEKATVVEDILKIEKELTRLTTEIERVEAQLQNLESRVSMSTLTVTFMTPAARPDQPRRSRSRFDWINEVGADRAMRLF